MRGAVLLMMMLAIGAMIFLAVPNVQAQCGGGVGQCPMWAPVYLTPQPRAVVYYRARAPLPEMIRVGIVRPVGNVAASSLRGVGRLLFGRRCLCY